MRSHFLENLRKEAKEKENNLPKPQGPTRNTSQAALNLGIAPALSNPPVPKVTSPKPKSNAVMPYSSKKPPILDPLLHHELAPPPRLESPTSEDNKSLFGDFRGKTPTSKTTPDALITPKEVSQFNRLFQQPTLNEFSRQEGEPEGAELNKMATMNKPGNSPEVKYRHSVGFLPPIKGASPKQSKPATPKPVKEKRSMTKIGILPKKFHGIPNLRSRNTIS